jgi:hypothetical protein
LATEVAGVEGFMVVVCGGGLIWLSLDLVLGDRRGLSPVRWL